LQRGAAGRIDLVAMVRFDDFDVVAFFSARAAMSSSLRTTLTPALMLGAITIGMCWAMRAISSF